MKIFFKLTTFIFGLLDKYRFQYYAHLYGRQLDVHPSVLLGRYSAVIITPGASTARLRIGRASRFRRFCLITLDAEGSLAIGENTFFNNYCSINCLGTTTIGNNTLFGEGVRLYDHNHIFNQADILVENQGCRIGTINIGNNCWIGSNCIILNNVTIGHNVVIGAGCVVAASIPDNTIVRGVQSLTAIPIVFR